MKINIEAASRPCPGEQKNGDAFVLRREGELYFWAVIDALGHGAGAAEVADAASEYLQKVPLSLNLAPLLVDLHHTLKHSRGAAALLIAVLGEQLVGCGVGNISIRSTRAAFSIISSPGVLGLRGPNPKAYHTQIGAGDRLAIFSDGISARFSWEGIQKLPTKEAASFILTNHGRSHDDATVVVADVTA